MLRQAQGSLSFHTNGQDLHDITQEVGNWLRDQDADQGLLTLFCRHTSASLTIQENADPDVRFDLKRFFERLVPDDPSLYRHTMEGPDDMPAHIKAALTDVSLQIPVSEGRLLLGTWQGLYLFEHRLRPHRRSIVLHYIGD